jgi:hypothetical protein
LYLKRATLKHIIIKLSKVKNKKKILEEKSDSLHTRKPLSHITISKFLRRNLAGQEVVGSYFTSAKKSQKNPHKTYQIRIIYPAKLSLKN